MVNKVYANSIARAKEKSLLGRERYSRLLDCQNLESAIKVLSEVNFGDANINALSSVDEIIVGEEKKLIEFIKINAPTDWIKDFFLIKNDFINAEAFIKAKYLKIDAEKMSTLDGKFTKAYLQEKIMVDEYKSFPTELAKALITCDDYFVSHKASGELISATFSKAYYQLLIRVGKQDKRLNKIVINKIDCANVTTALRARNFAYASDFYIEGGLISKEQFKRLCENSLDSLKEEFKFSSVANLITVAIDCLSKQQPLREFERLQDSYPLNEYKIDKYSSEGVIPFMLYCLYKKADLINVRIILTGIINKLDKTQIKEILRDSYDG